MEISIDKEILAEVNDFVTNKMVSAMNDYGLSFQAMGFALQTLLDGIDEARKALDND